MNCPTGVPPTNEGCCGFDPGKVKSVALHKDGHTIHVSADFKEKMDAEKKKRIQERQSAIISQAAREHIKSGGSKRGWKRKVNGIKKFQLGSYSK